MDSRKKLKFKPKQTWSQRGGYSRRDTRDRYDDDRRGDERRGDDRRGDDRRDDDRDRRPPRVPAGGRGTGSIDDRARENTGKRRTSPTREDLFPEKFTDPEGGRETAIALAPASADRSGYASFGCFSSGNASFSKGRFRSRTSDGLRILLDIDGHDLPTGMKFDPPARLLDLPHPDKGILACEANALAAVQAVGSACSVDMSAFLTASGSRSLEWMERSVQYPLMQV
ncbi:hypothetical protein Dimus_038018 [Dionaea muscipula]